MKKFFFLLTGAALMFAGCAKVENENTQVVPEKGTHSVTLQATISNADTRVSADNNGVFAWQETDQISVITKYGSLEGELVFSNGITITNDKATFTFDLNEGQTLGQYAFYPAAEGCGVDSDGFIGFGLRHQLDYAPGVTNMPMLGTLSSNGASFAPVGGVIKLTVANVPSEANYLRFSVPDKKIAGTFLVDNGAIAAEDYDGSDLQAYNYVDIIIPDYCRESTMEFYIAVPTGNLGNPTFAFYKTGQTDPLYSVSPRIQGGLVIERKDIIVPPELDASPNYSGEWIMVGEHNSEFYACPAYSSENNIKGVRVTVDREAVTSDNQTIKMTFKKVNSGDYKGLYTIQDANDWYLYAASSGNNWLKARSSIDSGSSANYYWSIADDGNGGFSIVASKSGNHNKLRYNGGSNLFSCYDKDSSTGSNVKLYRWEDAIFVTPTCVTPSISCANNIVTITSDTAGATIYYEIGATETTTIDPTTSSSVYDPSNKPSIAADSYVKAIAVADGYNNSAVAGASVTYTEPSGDTWALVTDASTLSAGDVIVFACNSFNAVAGPLNNNLLTKVDAVFSNDLNTISYLPSNALQFTLGGSSSAWTLNCSEGRLYSPEAKKVNFSDGTGTWIISGNNGNLTVSYENSSCGNLQYNHNGGNARFTTYTSTQTAIQIYRKQTTSPSTDWSTINESGVPLVLTGSSNAVTAQVRINNVDYGALRVGSSSNSGFVRINKPEGKRYLHAHLAAWNGETVKVSIKNSANQVIQELSLTSDSGVSGSVSTFTLNGSSTDYYFKIDTKKTEELDLWFESTTGKRFVIWGVNASEN